MRVSWWGWDGTLKGGNYHVFLGTLESWKTRVPKIVLLLFNLASFLDN